MEEAVPDDLVKSWGKKDRRPLHEAIASEKYSYSWMASKPSTGTSGKSNKWENTSNMNEEATSERNTKYQ